MIFLLTRDRIAPSRGRQWKLQASERQKL